MTQRVRFLNYDVIAAFYAQMATGRIPTPHQYQTALYRVARRPYIDIMSGTRYALTVVDIVRAAMERETQRKNGIQLEIQF